VLYQLSYIGNACRLSALDSTPAQEADYSTLRVQTQLEKRTKTRKKTHLRFQNTGNQKKTGKTFWRRIPLEQVHFSAVADNWSWRRDLNPRPSDYKSDALPAELRQQTFPRAQLSIDT
jgi:hypothetical protein